MKNEEPFHDEIGTLLRSQSPDPATPAGLEARILRRLDSPPPKPAVWRWSWLLAPVAAGAVAVVMVMHRPQPAPVAVPLAQTQKPVAVEPVADPIEDLYEKNPLRQESLALQRDADRAGDFLKECLPSFTRRVN